MKHIDLKIHRTNINRRVTVLVLNSTRNFIWENTRALVWRPNSNSTMTSIWVSIHKYRFGPEWDSILDPVENTIYVGYVGSIKIGKGYI